MVATFERDLKNSLPEVVVKSSMRESPVPMPRWPAVPLTVVNSTLALFVWFAGSANGQDCERLAFANLVLRLSQLEKAYRRDHGGLGEGIVCRIRIVFVGRDGGGHAECAHGRGRKLRPGTSESTPLANLPMGIVTELNCWPGGPRATTITPVASDGPLFVTVTV